MRPSLLAVLCAPFVAIAGAALYGQSTSQPSLPTPEDRGPDRLVEQRSADIAQTKGRIGQRGGAKQLTALEAVVRSYFRASPRSVSGITNAAALDGLDVQQLAIFLAFAGYDPSDLSGNRTRAEGLVQSASRVVLGRSTIADEVAVSPDVFVGRLRSVDSSANGGDGFRSTAAFDVSVPIKGNLAAGSSANVRQRSGPAGGENIIVFGEFTSAMVGQEFLLFATPAAYQLRSRTAGGAADLRSMILAPYEVRNGQAQPMVSGQTSSGFTVASLGRS